MFHHSSTTSDHSEAKPDGFYHPGGVCLHAQRYSFIIPLSCSAAHMENAGFGDYFHIRVVLLKLTVPKCAVALQKLLLGRFLQGVLLTVIRFIKL